MLARERSSGSRRIMLHCFHTPRLPPPPAHLQRQRHLAAAPVAGAQSAAQPRPAPLPSGLQCLLCATSLFKQSLKFMRSTSRIWVRAGGGWGRGAPKMLPLLPVTRGPHPAAGLRLPASRSPPPASKCAFYFQPRRLHRSSLPHSEPPDCLTALISRCAYACCAGPRPTPQSCRAGGQAGGQARQGRAGQGGGT